MNTRLTLKKIQDKCGSVSYKRGETYFQQNQVVVVPVGIEHWEAIVKAHESFHVTVQMSEDGSVNTTCSCPTLASFNQACQHTAAALLSIYHQQKKDFTPEEEAPTKEQVMDPFLTLFEDSANRPFGEQKHFETRTKLETTVNCHPLTLSNGTSIMAVELVIQSERVNHLVNFLKDLHAGHSAQVSSSFFFDSNQFCFKTETETVIRQLIQVVQDAYTFTGVEGREEVEQLSPHLLWVPPSIWDTLYDHLKRLRNVGLEYEGRYYEGLMRHDAELPIEFELNETSEGPFCLHIKKIKEMTVLHDYHFAIVEGKMKQLAQKDSQRLWELTKLLRTSNRGFIEIPEEQINYFKEKVFWGLKRLGRVKETRGRETSAHPFPLKAKLYLDRIKNRLLAGLEFHYENVVIHPQDHFDGAAAPSLMRDLEKENAILELMADSQFTQTDGGYYLHNEELEFIFLTQILPKIQKLVQVYATTAVRNRVSKDVFKPQIRVRVKKERLNLLEFKFDIKGISDEEIRGLLLALEEKRKYYRLQNETLVALETKGFEDVWKFLQRPEISREDLLKGLDLPVHSSLKLLDLAESNDVFKLEASFNTFLKKLENPKLSSYPVPESLQSTLRPYQVKGYQWLKTLAEFGFGGILADDMGLGKTIQSIAFILSNMEESRVTQKRILIVCPSSLTYNWLRELTTFAPELRAAIVDGNPKERKSLLQGSEDLDVLITSYPLLRRDSVWYEKEQFLTVFFDEAQAFKNPISQTARAVKRLQADHRFALTGTPLENALEELWSIFHVVFPELLSGLKVFSTLSHAKIAKRIRPFMLRRMKKDVLDELPAKKSSTVVVDLLPEQKQLYLAYLAKLKTDTLKHLDKETRHRNRIRILAGITRLRQICCHPLLFVEDYRGSSAKFEQLLNLLTEAKYEGRRVLIFSQFTKMLQMVGKKLMEEGRPYFYLDGQTPNADRLQLCQRFNEGERDLFLISLKAGGTGLNLTGADTVILYDTWWNPAVEEQATDRAHRMGQLKEVQVIKLVARGTIEEKMNELQEKKRALINEMIDSNGNEVTSSTLTDDDLKELLMSE